jgi:hypothetical protein
MGGRWGTAAGGLLYDSRKHLLQVGGGCSSYLPDGSLIASPAAYVSPLPELMRRGTR